MSRPDIQLRRLARVGDGASSVVRTAFRPVASMGFPYRRATVPKGVVVATPATKLGADFDTEWARRAPARAVRAAFVNGPLKAFVTAIARPEVVGVDRLAALRALDEPPPLIFTPTHHSHLDTAVMLSAVPQPWRSKLVLAAAADYFFDRRTSAVVSALAFAAIPIDREGTGRKSSDLLRRLVDDGWSLIIYPEGGRSPDGWGQEFKGGAAYVSSRTGAAVVPVFIDGTGSIYGKGMRRPKPGATKVVFGAPLTMVEGESTRRFNARIEQAVTVLGDEALTDFWTARRRAADGTSPKLTGPDYQGWRRQWALAEQRKLGKAGQRRRQKRRWPDLG